MSNKIFFFVLVFFTSLLLMTSCGNTNSGRANLVAMYGLVNGSNWRSSEPTAIISEKKIKITGTSANGQTIIITLNSSEVGEYTFSSTNGHYAEFIPNMTSGSERFSTLNGESGSGFVRISSINEETKTIGGEFYFKAYREDGKTVRSVTEGKFNNVPYTYYNLGEESYTNVFSFTYDGVVWNAKDISATKSDTSMVVFGDCDRAEAWQSIKLKMQPNISAGVHYIGTDVYAEFQQGFYTFAATNGAITIIENNSASKIIKGSFFFNYEDNNNATQSISDGKFDVEFTDLTIVE